jgi:hypothetical protein
MRALGRVRLVAAGVFAAVLLCGVVVPAVAYINAVSGNVIWLSTPPADVRPAGISDPTNMFAFDEQQGATLAAPLRVDFVNPGTYTGVIGATYLPVGTVVDSHFIDSSRSSLASGGSTSREGTITFAQDIVGVIATRGKLAESDVLGAPGTVYGGAYPSREMDFGGGDWLRIDNARQVFIHAETMQNTDQVRVLTKHNNPPAVNGGGNRSGNEGSTINLTGVASDPDLDPLTYQWTFSASGDHPAGCTYGGTTSLTATVTCDDDAVVTATFKAKDAYHAFVTAAPVTVTVNNVAPAIGSVTLPAGEVPLATPVNLSATFSDLGTFDTHNNAGTTINWGDATTTTGSVSESGGTGSVTGSHTYTTSGTMTVTVTVRDDNGGTDSETATVTVNGPPTAAAGGPYSGDEGGDVSLLGTASDPDDPSLTTTWVFTPGAADAGTSCTYTGTNTLTPTVNCNDDVVVDAELTVDDALNPAVSDSTSVSITDAAPVVNTPSASAGPIKVGDTVDVSAAFADQGTNDSHDNASTTIDWGDSSGTVTGPGLVTETVGTGTGTVDASHAYTAPGDYTVTVTVTDDDGMSGSNSTTVHVNAPPTASAGGPYSGLEGEANVLSGGSASDADFDPLTTTWSIVGGSVSPASTTCSLANAGSLSGATVTCDDDATLTVRLTVSDGVYPSVVSTATLDVGNANPVPGALHLSPNTTVHTGETISISPALTFNDAGTHDTHTAIIDWGDNSGLDTVGTVVESSGSGTVTGSHVYNTVGTFLVTVTVIDDENGTGIASASTGEVVNDPPVISAGPDESTTEGIGVTLSGTATDTEDDTMTYSWLVSATGPNGINCVTTGATTLSPTITCDDNGTVTAVLTVDDGHGNTPQDTAVITVSNVAPTASSVSLSASVVVVGTSVSASASFADAGTHDTHTAVVNWDDGNTTSASVTETSGSGTASGSHTYTTQGVYDVTITITDDDTGSVIATATTYLVVYDPGFGHVKVQAQYDSPSGAYTPDDITDPDFTGNAKVGMEVHWVNITDTTPSGQADLKFDAANLQFNSSGFLWMVVDDPGTTWAIFRGTGTVNGDQGPDGFDYDFLMSVDETASAVRIQVTVHTTGVVLYDTQPHEPDTAPATTVATGLVSVVDS